MWKQLHIPPIDFSSLHLSERARLCLQGNAASRMGPKRRFYTEKKKVFTTHFEGAEGFPFRAEDKRGRLAQRVTWRLTLFSCFRRHDYARAAGREERLLHFSTGLEAVVPFVTLVATQMAFRAPFAR